MVSYQIKIGLADTDASGALFFPRQFEMALKALEAFLETSSFSVSKLFTTSYLFPVVHAEAEYKKSLSVGDLVEVMFRVEKVGISSVTTSYLLQKEGVCVGRVQLVHVLIDRETKEKRDLPEFMKNLFEESLARGELPREV